MAQTELLTTEDIQSAFEAELTRLHSLGLTPEQETLARRYYSDKERQSMSADQFCGPHRSFPITSAADVSNAAHLIGHADDPGAVKACIIRKAKANGWSLPDNWKEDGERVLKADDNCIQCGDETSVSEQASTEETQERATTHDATPPAAIQSSDRHVISLPFVRIDAAKREVWGQATAEVPDSYGTIFGYYPEAWKKWRGNIREQHDPKKAVGKRVDLECSDQERAIYVGSRVSRGAQDTWLKVEDDVLAGYSASIIPDPEFGNDPRRWPKKEYNGKEYPYLPRYTVAELSLVDNPACPGCDIQIVRADGFATDVLDLTEDEPAVEQKQETQDRAGARVGSATKSKMHESIGHTLHAAVSQMKNCDCPDCQGAMKIIDPDDDNDIDLGGYDDPDNDWKSLYNKPEQDMERVITELIERSLQPVYSRLQGIAGTLARSNSSATPMNIEQIVTSTITRAFETFESRMTDLPTKSSLDEVRAELSVVKGQVDRIAEQPMPGGPVLNASVMPRPIEKTLATDPMPQQPDRSYGAVYEAIQEMSRRGGLDTPDKQVEAMAAALQAQRGGRR